jgi:hypothetical protein
VPRGIVERLLLDKLTFSQMMQLSLMHPVNKGTKPMRAAAPEPFLGLPTLVRGC